MENIAYSTQDVLWSEIILLYECGFSRTKAKLEFSIIYGEKASAASVVLPGLNTHSFSIMSVTM